jgi:hypothetical protein
MNARTLIAATSTALLTACAAGGQLFLNERYFMQGIIVQPLDTKINVTVEEATVIVSREPFKVKRKEIGQTQTYEPITVTFKLGTSGFEFAPMEMSPDPLKWVAIKSSQPLGATTCVYGNSGADKTELDCTFTPLGPRDKKQYHSYTLRLKDLSTGQFIVSDPSMMN